MPHSSNDPSPLQSPTEDEDSTLRSNQPISRSKLVWAALVLSIGTLIGFLLRGGKKENAVTIGNRPYANLVVRNMATDLPALPRNSGHSTLKCATGDLLHVVGEGIQIYHRFTGNEQLPLQFVRTDFRTYLHDKIVGLDLSTPASVEWLRSADQTDLQSIRTVTLLGQQVDDVTGLLSDLPNSLVLITSWDWFLGAADDVAELFPEGLVLLGGRRPQAAADEVVGLKALSQFSNLKVLSLIECDFDGDLSPLSSLTTLEYFTIQSGVKVKDITPIESMVELRTLRLRDCNSLEDISPAAKLANLQFVDFTGCRSVRDVSPLSHLDLVAFKASPQTTSEQLDQVLQASPGILSLDLKSCAALEDFHWLENGKSLQSIAFPPQVTDQQLGNAISYTPAVQDLDLRFSERLSDLAPLSSLANLTRLDISGCNGIQDVSALIDCNQLRELFMVDCRSISDLTSLGRLIQLENLNMASCVNAEDLAPLANLVSLRRLMLGANYGSRVGGLRLDKEDHDDYLPCERFQDLAPLESLTRLERLDILSCPKLTDVSAIKHLTALQHLSLVRCFKLRDISPMETLTMLENLELVHGEGLIELSPIAKLQNLRQLNIGAPSFVSGGDQDRDLTPIASLDKLEVLSLTCCDGLSDITAISSLHSLRELNLFGCSSIEDLAPLRELKNLQYVNLVGCDKVKRRHRQPLRVALPFALVLPHLPPEPVEPPTRQLSTEEVHKRKQNMSQALGLLPSRANKVSLSFTREGGQDITDVTASSDRSGDALKIINSKGCAEGLLNASRHVAFKPDIVKYFQLEFRSVWPEFAAVQNLIGAADRTEVAMHTFQEELGFGFPPRKVDKRVNYHIYGWIQFGEVDGRIRVLRVDCTKLPPKSE